MKFSALIFSLFFAGSLAQGGGGNRGGIRDGGRGGGGGPRPDDGGREGSGGGLRDDNGDITPPSISNRRTKDSETIGTADYEMIATVTDDSEVQFVRFRVGDPDGNTVEYQARQISPGEYTADVLFFINGAYTSRVEARDINGNMAITDPISFSVEGVDETPPTPPTPPTTLEALLAQAKAAINRTINQNPRIAATYLRLAFHDCVPGTTEGEGGCDGCVNMANPGNAGLLPALNALAPIVRDFENAVLGVSRADLWAYAAMVASEASQNNLEFTSDFNIGRLNCETVGTCDSGSVSDCATMGPDGPTDFPENDLTTHGLIDFMAAHFGFDADETVAIVGAHTIGRALRENSGFNGERGWVNNEFDLDNEYYRQIVGGDNTNDANTDVNILADAPNWNQNQVTNDEPIPDVFQWDRGGGGGQGGGQNNRLRRNLQGGGGGGGGGGPIFMLNADIAIVRDLGEVGDGLIEADGEANCSFRFNQGNACPLAETLTKAGIYRANNFEWLSDFRDVMVIMIEKGLE